MSVTRTPKDSSRRRLRAGHELVVSPRMSTGFSAPACRAARSRPGRAPRMSLTSLVARPEVPRWICSGTFHQQVHVRRRRTRAVGGAASGWNCAWLHHGRADGGGDGAAHDHAPNLVRGQFCCALTFPPLGAGALRSTAHQLLGGNFSAIGGSTRSSNNPSIENLYAMRTTTSRPSLRRRAPPSYNCASCSALPADRDADPGCRRVWSGCWPTR